MAMTCHVNCGPQEVLACIQDCEATCLWYLGQLMIVNNHVYLAGPHGYADRTDDREVTKGSGSE